MKEQLRYNVDFVRQIEIHRKLQNQLEIRDILLYSPIGLRITVNVNTRV